MSNHVQALITPAKASSSSLLMKRLEQRYVQRPRQEPGSGVAG